MIQRPTLEEVHDRTMKHESTEKHFRAWLRNGRWGTCCDCPQDRNHDQYPEFCDNSERWDHQLTTQDLFERYNQQNTIAKEFLEQKAERDRFNQRST